jgi:hypothetical protein
MDEQGDGDERHQCSGHDERLRAVLKKHTGDRDAAHHPEGTRRVFCLFSIVPGGLAAPPPEPPSPRLRLPPFRPARQPAGLTRPPNAVGVRVSPKRVVALREEQNMIGHRLEAPAAERAGVRRGLEIVRAAELPPARLGHFWVVVVVGAGGTGHL